MQIDWAYMYILQGRTMGEIIREDANIEGIYVGLKDEEMKNIATVAPPSTMFLCLDSLTPTWVKLMTCFHKFSKY